MFKNIYYKTLVWTSYQIGDLLSHIPFEWAFDLYQKAMNFSVECDEKIGFWLWQEPPLNREEDL